MKSNFLTVAGLFYFLSYMSIPQEEVGGLGALGPILERQIVRWNFAQKRLDRTLARRYNIDNEISQCQILLCLASATR